MSRSTDFSDLFIIHKDMKDIFRRLQRKEDRFHRALSFAHNKFYQKIFKKRKMLYDGMQQMGSSDVGYDYIYKQPPKFQKQTKGLPEQKKKKDEDMRLQVENYSGKINWDEKEEEEIVQTDKSENPFLKVLYQSMKEEQRQNFIKTESLPSKEVVDLLEQQQQHNQLLHRLLTENVVNTFKSYEFSVLMQKKDIIDDLAFKLYQKAPQSVPSIPGLKHALQFCDKEQFMKFREGQLTYNQLLQRVDEKRFGVKFTVLDDLKKDLEESIVRDDLIDKELMKAQEYARKMGIESHWQPDKRCINSIFKKAERKRGISELDERLKQTHKKEVKEKKVQMEKDRQEQREKEFTEKWTMVDEKQSAMKAKKQASLEERKKLNTKEKKNLHVKIYNQKLKEQLQQIEKVQQAKIEKQKREYNFGRDIEQAHQSSRSKDHSIISIGDNIDSKRQKRKEDLPSESKGVVVNMKDKMRKKEQKRQNMLFLLRLKDEGQKVIMDDKIEALLKYEQENLNFLLQRGKEGSRESSLAIDDKPSLPVLSEVEKTKLKLVSARISSVNQSGMSTQANDLQNLWSNRMSITEKNSFPGTSREELKKKHFQIKEEENEYGNDEEKQSKVSRTFMDWYGNAFQRRATSSQHNQIDQNSTFQDYGANQSQMRRPGREIMGREVYGDYKTHAIVKRIVSMHMSKQSSIQNISTNQRLDSAREVADKSMGVTGSVHLKGRPQSSLSMSNEQSFKKITGIGRIRFSLGDDKTQMVLKDCKINDSFQFC